MLFNLSSADHESHEPLCLSLGDTDDPDGETWGAYYRAARLLLAADDVDQPAFFVLRQFVELSLKRPA